VGIVASESELFLPFLPLDKILNGSSVAQEAHWIDVGYSLNISVGSPPQEVPVFLSISMSDSWVTTTSLPGRQRVCSEAPVFDTTASSTFSSTDKSLYFYFPWGWGRGPLSHDMLRFGPVSARYQAFAVPNTLYVDSWWYNYCPMSGVIGLAPFRSQQDEHAFGEPSPFASLVQQGALERNLFALRLREPAELSLGRVNESAFRGDFLAEVPLTDVANDLLNGGWQTRADYLAIEGGDNEARIALGDVPATFFTGTPIISVPQPAYDQIISATGCYPAHDYWLPPGVNCIDRPTMPNITFNLGGQNLTISAFDYAIPAPADMGDDGCFCMFAESSREVALGWVFLRAFYTVFDQDSSSIRCK